MATYLLDTSVIIDVLNGKQGRDQILNELLRQGHLLACCSINVTEVYAGLRPQEETRTRELLESLQYLPISWPVARLAGLLKRDYARKGITLATTDVTIAAIAIHHQLTLITDNLKHYPMKELSIYPLPKSSDE
jgi:predicted nucleic acid-binding protein